MLDKLKNWMRGVWRKLFPVNSIEKALNLEIDQDTIMSRAIELWANMYENRPPWVSDIVSTMGLPAAISNEIARLVTLELKSEVTGDSKHAHYLNEQYQKVIKTIRQYTEYACAKGGVVLKPYVSGDNITVEYVQADYFYPVKYGSDGSITGAVFVEQKQSGDTTYTRLEYHEFDGTKERIINKAFKSSTKDSLGNEIALSTLDEWKDLQPVADVESIEKPLFAYFKIPIANNVDTYSPLGQSVFGRAIDLIKEADKQYSRGLWEFESAERAIDIDVTAFKRGTDGNLTVPQGKERLFRTMDAEGGNTGKTFYETFSPDIRDESHARGLNSLLRLIEFNCGLAYGTLSDPQAEAKTATEVKQSKQRSYSTISDIQKSLQFTLEHLVYIMDVYAKLYNLSSAGDYEVSFLWDDSIVVDAEAERLRDIQEMREGIMSKVEYRMKWYGEDEKTAKQKIAEAQNENPNDEEILGLGKGDA